MASKNPVIKTLIYESIFDFPLKKEEIWKYLISDKPVGKKDFEEYLKDKKIYFDKKTGLYSLKKNNEIFQKRLVRERISLEKNKIAKRSAKFLSVIPTIELVGISGSLAQFSSDEDDDIDFFIICRKNTVWTTRFFAVVFLKFKNLYRTDTQIKDKICLNMITDTYSFSRDRKDLYNAFEIAQMRPFFKNKSYEKFIYENSWVNKFLPNFKIPFPKIESFDKSENKILDIFLKIILVLQFEKAAKLIQKIYMKRITSETVTDTLLAFHPRDFKVEIMQKFEAKGRDY